MKLNSNFITHDDGDEKMIVSTGTAKFSGLVRGNKSAGFIIDCLANDTTEAEILEKMKQNFDGSEELMAKDIKKIISQLREIGAIDD